jgi:hypothetical protein
MRLLVALAVVLSLGSVRAELVAAQDASPMASPAAGGCVAPDLPPSTPAAADAAPPASPPARAVPAGTPAAAALLSRIRAAEENIAACVTAGEYETFATLLTANFRLQIFGTPDAAGVVAVLREEGPITEEIVSVENAQTHADGRVSAEVVFTANGEPNHVRDIYVEVDGQLLLDQEVRLDDRGGGHAGALGADAGPRRGRQELPAAPPRPVRQC